MYVSADTAAFLLDLSPTTVRELLERPRSGLSRHIRTAPEHKLDALARQDLAKSVGTRILLWDVATFAAKRERAYKFDLSPPREPTNAEIRRIWLQMVAAAAVYRVLRVAMRKVARNAEKEMRRGVETAASKILGDQGQGGGCLE